MSCEDRAGLITHVSKTKVQNILTINFYFSILGCPIKYILFSYYFIEVWLKYTKPHMARAYN